MFPTFSKASSLLNLLFYFFLQKISIFPKKVVSLQPCLRRKLPKMAVKVWARLIGIVSCDALFLVS